MDKAVKKKISELRNNKLIQEFDEKYKGPNKFDFLKEEINRVNKLILESEDVSDEIIDYSKHLLVIKLKERIAMWGA
ncbi:MAG: hypothetical protein J6Y02_06385 [Pseudobutyrivibrio sp.]|nr:hypothetical protein [Pseudobutyrivibrio sp.]